MTPETTERTIQQRAGIGATGDVRQIQALALRNLAIEHAVLIVVIRGVKLLCSAGIALNIKQGDAVLLAGGNSFDVTNIPPAGGCYEALWISCDPAFASNDRPLSDRLLAEVLVRPSVEKTAYTIGDIPSAFISAIIGAAEAIRDPDVSDDIVRHRFSEIRLWLRERGIPWPNFQVHTLSTKIRHKLAAAPNMEWTTVGVAQDFAMSEATLRRRLAAEGTSLTALMVDVRMTYGLTLLQGTDKPIEQIAHASGYQSASRFSIRFRERFGFAPSEIRGHRR
jgi:AraC-like DNA-binding protein